MPFSALIFGGVTFAAGLILHVALWRVRLPEGNHTMALLKIFFALYALSYVFVLGPWVPLSAAQVVSYTLFYAGLVLSYLVTYSALEVNSPTLEIMLWASQRGHQGLSMEELRSRMTDDYLVLERLKDLRRDGMVTIQENGRYSLSKKGRRLARLFERYRRLLAAGMGG